MWIAVIGLDRVLWCTVSLYVYVWYTRMGQWIEEDQIVSYEWRTKNRRQKTKKKNKNEMPANYMINTCWFDCGAYVIVPQTIIMQQINSHKHSQKSIET